MANAQKPEVTKEEIQHARTLWAGFADLMKWGVVSVIVTLALMAFFLV